MKILHISEYTFRSQNIFREQRKRGWKPVVLTSPKHEQSWKGAWVPREEFDGITFMKSGSSGKMRPFGVIA